MADEEASSVADILLSCNSGSISFIILGIVALSICFFALFFVCVIGLPAIRKLHRMDKVKRSLKCTLYAAILTSLIIISSTVIMSLACMNSLPRFDATPILFTIAWKMNHCAALALLNCVLINFFLRLDVTFAGSVLAMSKTKRRTFLTFIFLQIFTLIAMMALYVSLILAFHPSVGVVITLMFFLFWLIYVVLSFALVREFNNNIMEMAKFCVGPLQNASNLKLNEFQQQQVNLSAKFLALYFIAAASSIIIFGYMTLTPLLMFPVQVWFSLLMIDVCVNICCLMLAFSPMGTVYTKCCQPIDGCCRNLTTALMKRRVRQILTEKDSNETKEEAQVEESGVLLAKVSESDSEDGSADL